MKRVYHTWDKWECYLAGFYENQAPDGMTQEDAQKAYRDFLRDLPRFESALERVVTDWRYSCEHYLSNETMNRIAWLGQAAMCYATKIPHAYRGGFNLLTETEQQVANEMALKWLNVWLTKQGEATLDLTGAKCKTKVELY